MYTPAITDPTACGVSPDVAAYVESHILPRYDTFDKAHRRDHALMVIDRSLQLARRLPELETDMVYCIAAFHDLGLAYGRENHHLDSGRIIRSDAFLAGRFSPAQIEEMARAAEDHRASGKTAPRSDYGKVVADADRFIDPTTIIRRTVQYGLAHYPQLDREGHYRRTVDHLTNKYGPQGYLRVWLPWSDNAAALRQLHRMLEQPERLRELFDGIFDAETRPEAAAAD